jgi:hypothetical protein
VRSDFFVDIRKNTGWDDAIWTYRTLPVVTSLGVGVDIKLNDKNTLTGGFDLHYIPKNNKDETYNRKKYYAGNNHKINLSEGSKLSVHTGVFEERQYAGRFPTDESDPDWGQISNRRRGIELGLGYERVLNKNLSFNAKIGYAQAVLPQVEGNPGARQEISASAGVHLRLNPSFKFNIDPSFSGPKPPKRSKYRPPSRGKHSMIPCPPSKTKK